MHNSDIIPEKFLGIKTDVLKMGQIKQKRFMNTVSNSLSIDNPLFTKLSSRVRPLQGGLNISPYTHRGTGTLGAIVFDDKDNPYILSNNHVLSRNGFIKKGAPILQPGVLVARGAFRNNIVANLSKVILMKPSIKGQKKIYNKCDAAIAKVVPGIEVDNSIYSIGTLRSGGQVSVGLPIRKIGAFSGLTESTIKSINVKIAIPTDEGNIWFRDQFLTNSNMSLGGDSGSIIFDPLDRVVGLLLGGDDEESIITPIDTVLKLFKIYI